MAAPELHETRGRGDESDESDEEIFECSFGLTPLIQLLFSEKTETFQCFWLNR